MFTENARQYWLGVFLCLQLSAGFGWADCPTATGGLQWARLSAVIDGDTLRLADGDKLRLIAVNTPELGRDGRPDQALARQAKQAVEAFLAGADRIGLRVGSEARDHYGRQLASVYDAGGQSLAAHLLSRGLGWQVAVPPNTHDWQCLRQQEQRARAQQLGVWARDEYRIQPAEQLSPDSAGFALVKGTVLSVAESQRGWWIDLPGISLRVAKKHWPYFAEQGVAAPRDWVGRVVEARGWIVNRRHNKAVIANGYAPLMMNIGHPVMIGID